MRILVIGGAGFIRSHTVDALLETRHDVRILDNLQKPVHLKGKPPWIPKEAEFISGDVRNKADWETALKGKKKAFHPSTIYRSYRAGGVKTSNVSPSRRLLRAGGQHRMSNKKNRRQSSEERGRMSEDRCQRTGVYDFILKNFPARRPRIGIAGNRECKN